MGFSRLAHVFALKQNLNSINVNADIPPWLSLLLHHSGSIFVLFLSRFLFLCVALFPFINLLIGI